MAGNTNYATMNPLIKTSNTMTYSFGNLRLGPPSSSFSSTDFCRSSMVVPKDKKIYAEIYAVAGTGGQHPIAVATTHAIPVGSIGGDGVVVLYENLKKVNGTTTSSWITTAAQGDVFQIAVDGATNKVWLGYNNTWGGSGNPSAGSNEAGTVNTSAALGFDLFLVSQGSTSSTLHWNFGGDSTFGGAISAGGYADANGFGDFKYAPPTNFLALCSGNLSISADIDPAQTSDDYAGGKQFNAVLYTGNGGAQSVTGFGFKPDLVWVKRRNSTQSHRLADSTRGAKTLYPDQNIAQDDMAISYTADGFDWGTGTGAANNANASGGTYVAWGWKFAGGTTATNNVGNVQTTTQANTKAGQSIVQWTGTGTNSRTIGTGLTKQAEFVIVKRYNTTGSWLVYHHQAKGGAQPNDYGVLVLNSSQAYGEGSGALTYWDVSEWTDTVFSVGGDSQINGSGDSMLAYCWHGVEGYSKFGYYEGNGNADGPFVYTGFRPRMIFLKDADRGESWVTFDSARNTFNSVDKGLFYNAASAESTGSGSGFDVDFLSNGFKLRCSHDNMNGSSTYIYGAWGDVPFKYNNTF